MSFLSLLNKKTMRKVPEVIVLFWVIKLLTTAMGEATSDFLVKSIDPVMAVILGFIGFVFAISLQFYVKKYIAFVYWLAVIMVAIFGTMAADVVHIVLGVPYILSTIAFAITLAIVFVLWYKTEHTLSIHSIYTVRRELFYWLTVVTTFALGTATGDLTALTFNLGYLNSGLLFGILFVLPLIEYKIFKLNEVFAFWFAYIMTRPFGASFADLFGRSKGLGGLGYGTGRISLILTIFIILLVSYLYISKKDIKIKE